MNSEARRQSAETQDDEDSDEPQRTDHDEESESEHEDDDPSEHDEQPEVVQSKRGIRPLCEIDPPSDMLSHEEGEEEAQSSDEETDANTPITIWVDESPLYTMFQNLIGPNCG